MLNSSLLRAFDCRPARLPTATHTRVRQGHEKSAISEFRFCQNSATRGTGPSCKIAICCYHSGSGIGTKIPFPLKQVMSPHAQGLADILSISSTKRLASNEKARSPTMSVTSLMPDIPFDELSDGSNPGAKLSQKCWGCNCTSGSILSTQHP